jgi:uncharacterized protein YabE (DUF348 family)
MPPDEHRRNPRLVFGLLCLLALVHALGTVRVTLKVDGLQRQFRSRAGTVGDFLLEQAVAVEPGDLVLPGRHARLRDGQEVIVQRARPVEVLVDGRKIRLKSHGRSALALLGEAGVSLGPMDRVKVNERAWPLDRQVTTGDERELPSPSSRTGFVRIAEAAGQAQAAPDPQDLEPPTEADGLLPGEAETWRVEVLRAQSVTLIEDGISVAIETSGASVREALEAAGFSLLEGDELSPPGDSALKGGMRITLERATPFVVITGEISQTLRARADTVGEALEKTGLALVGRDYSIPAADAPLVARGTVEVIRVVEDILVQEVPIAYDTLTEADASTALDETRVVRAGEPGLKSQRIAITYENGVEINRQIEEEVVLREPVAEIIAYGTQIVWRTVNTEEGPRQYWRRLRVYATSYSASRAGTPKSAPWYGRTRLGWPMRKGLVAVDPRFIALRTNLYVPGFGVGIAADTGGGIKRYHIDLGFDDDNYESWHQWVDLYLLDPLPPERDMVWILP